MEASDFDESNLVLDPPPGMSYEDCTVLNVLKTKSEEGWPLVISCWKLTHEELEEIQKTGRLYLVVFGESMPPVGLVVKKPWVIE